MGPPHHRLQELDIEGELAVFDPADERVVMLNHTAGDVWRLSDGEHALEEIVELLAGAYAVEPGAVRDEVIATVQNLRAQGLLPEPG